MTEPIRVGHNYISTGMINQLKAELAKERDRADKAERGMRKLADKAPFCPLKKQDLCNMFKGACKRCRIEWAMGDDNE